MFKNGATFFNSENGRWQGNDRATKWDPCRLLRTTERAAVNAQSRPIWPTFGDFTENQNEISALGISECVSLFSTPFENGAIFFRSGNGRWQGNDKAIERDPCRLLRTSRWAAVCAQSRYGLERLATNPVSGFGQVDSEGLGFRTLKRVRMGWSCLREVGGFWEGSKGEGRVKKVKGVSGSQHCRCWPPGGRRGDHLSHSRITVTKPPETLEFATLSHYQSGCHVHELSPWPWQSLSLPLLPSQLTKLQR